MAFHVRAVGVPAGAGADICALSSMNEGTPVSIIEAMASGMAVITTKVGGVEDFVNNGENGLICEQDVTKFAESLEKLISDRSLRKSLGEKAQVAVTQQFDYRRLVSDVDVLYKRLLKN